MTDNTLIKTCFNCGVGLPSTLDEFGDWNTPLCQTCFLTYERPEETPKAHEVTPEAKAEYERLIEKRERFRSQIDGLESILDRVYDKMKALREEYPGLEELDT